MLHVDIIPSGYDCSQKLSIGDAVEIVVDSQFFDNSIRRFGQSGIIVSEDFDEWGYEVRFMDGYTNWFKRYHLKKV